MFSHLVAMPVKFIAVPAVSMVGIGVDEFREHLIGEELMAVGGGMKQIPEEPGFRIRRAASQQPQLYVWPHDGFRFHYYWWLPGWQWTHMPWLK